MKVILLEDVKSLGKKGQIVNVSDGYARNMILPKKLGVEATSKNLNDLKLRGRTFGSVSSKEISEAAKKQLNLDIDKKKLQLENPIRNLGVTNVPVRLHPKVTGSLKVWVKEA